MKARKKVIPGGTSAAKTFAILIILIQKAIRHRNIEISIVSESVPHLRRGAIRDFLKIMKGSGRYQDAHYNRTLLTYTFSSGSFIEFFSADEESKVRGARRNILFINECNNLSFSTYHQLAIRTSHSIYLDFNPSNEFWVHTELIGSPDVEVLTLTYKDNEALPKSIVLDIETARDKAVDSAYWLNWWRVYGLGQLGTLQGVVFDNWEIIKDIPEHARLIGYGLDFGYTNDPTAIAAVYKYNDTVVFDEVIYETGLTNQDINVKLESNGVKKVSEIIADSAEPKSIEELKRFGWRVQGASKGKDSINAGIQVMQQYRFLVTERSTNLIKELRQYMWETDKTGKNLNKPIDSYNHLMDAIRYLSIMKLGNKTAAAVMRTSGYRKRHRN